MISLLLLHLLCPLFFVLSVFLTRTPDSDNNPKLVHVSYDQAKAKGDDEGKAGGKLIVEKTDQVMGSCAGAG